MSSEERNINHVLTYWPLTSAPKYFYYKIRKLPAGDNRFWVDSALFLELRLSRAI